MLAHKAHCRKLLYLYLVYSTITNPLLRMYVKCNLLQYSMHIPEKMIKNNSVFFLRAGDYYNGEEMYSLATL